MSDMTYCQYQMSIISFAHFFIRVNVLTCPPFLLIVGQPACCRVLHSINNWKWYYL